MFWDFPAWRCHYIICHLSRQWGLTKWDLCFDTWLKIGCKAEEHIQKKARLVMNSFKKGKCFFTKVGPNRSSFISYNLFIEHINPKNTQINLHPPPGFEPRSFSVVSRCCATTPHRRFDLFDLDWSFFVVVNVISNCEKCLNIKIVKTWVEKGCRSWMLLKT